MSRVIASLILIVSIINFSQASYESAHSKYLRGDISGAVSEITRDIFNGVRDHRSYLLLIKIYKEQIRDYKQAVEYAIEGIRLFPDKEKEFLLELGELYYLQQKYQSAEEILKTFNSKYPGEGKGLFLLGKVFYSQNKFHKAVASLEASISSGEKSLEAYEYLGKSLRKIGNYNKALEIFSFVYNQTRKEEILGIIIEISSIMDVDYTSYLSGKRIITVPQKISVPQKSGVSAPIQPSIQQRNLSMQTNLQSTTPQESSVKPIETTENKEVSEE